MIDTDNERVKCYGVTNAYRTFIACDDFTYEQKGQITAYLCYPDKYPKPDFDFASFVLQAIAADCDAILDSRKKMRYRQAKHRGQEIM